ncbi:MAG TPA: HPP family protein, partial [Marinobacter hydrocarbonoclasticus]|nr:HPP family protein [Marinobacter nauticus]
VALLLAHAFVMNRLAGIPYPLWSASTGSAPIRQQAPAAD